MKDIILYNSASESGQSEINVNALVQYDGKVTMLPPGIFESNCNVEIKYFPFDEQKCTLRFAR